MKSSFKQRLLALAEAAANFGLNQAAGCNVIFDDSPPEVKARAQAACRNAGIPLIVIRFVAPPEQFEVIMQDQEHSCRWESPTTEPVNAVDAEIQSAVAAQWGRL